MSLSRYRAWDKENSRMVYPNTDDVYFVLTDDGINILDMSVEPFDDVFPHLDAVLMQYTGLKDKNGVEIFEGDMLKCTSGIYTNLGATGIGEYEETIKQVIWKDDSWGTRVISSNLTSKGAEKSGLVISAKYAEVIGYNYENHELLEDK